MSITVAESQRAFDQALREALNEAMVKAAEPIIQQALREAEREMRTRLAAHLIGMIERNMDISRMGRDLVIRLRQEVGR